MKAGASGSASGALPDDLHWADRATLDWPGYAVQRLRDQPFLLVGAYRPEDAPQAPSHLATGWAREGLRRRLSLPRLTDQDTAARAPADALALA